MLDGVGEEAYEPLGEDQPRPGGFDWDERDERDR